MELSASLPPEQEGERLSGVGAILVVQEVTVRGAVGEGEGRGGDREGRGEEGREREGVGDREDEWGGERSG